MATSRQERMQERMRGAQRHQVQDTSFGLFLDLPEDEPAALTSAPPPPPPPVSRTTPNTSAKRRRLDEAGSSAKVPQSLSQPQTEVQLRPPSAGSAASARRRLRTDPYSMTDQSSVDEHATARASVRRITPNATKNSSANARSTTPVPRDGGSETMIPLATPHSVAAMEDIVTESPADAPGSGQRRRVRISAAPGSSALLQAAIGSEDGTGELAQSSSPLSRKGKKPRLPPSAKSTRTITRRSTRLSAEQASDEHEVPSHRPSRGPQDMRRSRLDVSGTVDELDDEAGSVEEQPQEPELSDAENAVEIDNAEAARRLGKKRPRRSLPAPSPELVSSGAAAEEEEPVSLRPRKARKKSPAKQNQPRASNTKAAISAKKKDNQGHGAIQVGVQRFPHPRDPEVDDPDADELLSEIPFANRAGVNAVDVFSQLVEEMYIGTKERLVEAAGEAEDSASRREFRTKVAALDAFIEELRTRFLEQTIALDTLHALKKRVRQAQKEKLSLRNEILRIRAERDQVALRMDAVRIKHEEQSKVAHHHMDISTAMHDIDLAVEKGLAAPDLSAADKRTADLANLESVISKVSEQACSTAAGGGTLNQIRSFNAFLERAATVLESR